MKSIADRYNETFRQEGWLYTVNFKILIKIRWFARLILEFIRGENTAHSLATWESLISSLTSVPPSRRLRRR